MKGVTLLVLLMAVVSAHARIPYRPRSCIDCRFRLVQPGARYYDGCNWCTCTGWFPRRASCTLMWCPYNRCFKQSRG